MQNGKTVRRVLIAAILANLAIIALIASDTKAIGGVSEWEKFTPKKGNFSVSYPKGWREVEMDTDTQFETRFYGSENAYLTVTLGTKGRMLMDTMRSGRKSGEASLDVTHERFVTRYTTGLNMLKKTTAEKITLGDAEAYRSTIEYNTWDGFMGREMKGQMLSVRNADGFLVLGFFSPSRDFRRMSGVFDEFLKSLNRVSEESAGITTRLPGMH